MSRSTRQAVLLVFPLLAVIELAAQTRNDNVPLFRSDVVESSVPLVTIADAFEYRYERPIAVEQPYWGWVWEQEHPVAGQEAGRWKMMSGVQPRLAIRLPKELTGSPAPELSVGLLERMLAEYHRQDPAVHYKVLRSKLGLHIVPESVRGPGGEMGPARNVMDTVITVPEETRTASYHLKAIFDELSRILGLRMVASAPGIREDWFEELFAAPGGELKWGAKEIPARDAFVDLLDRSATSFSMRLFCDPRPNPILPPGCRMELRPIEIEPTAANGRRKYARVEFDRRKR